MLAEAAQRLALLRERRERQLNRIRERARQGLSGLQLARETADTTEQLLLELLDFHLWSLDEQRRRTLEQNVALVALGGLGRREMAPYSDVDLLVLCPERASKRFADVLTAFVRDCWDAGLTLGHSFRTVSQTLADARTDPHLATALIEARHVWGAERLTAQLQRQFRRRLVVGRRSEFVAECIANRQEERLRHGATMQQLEPNVKRSVGGLRDLHLIRWIAFARFGRTDLQGLVEKGRLAPEEAAALEQAADYLWRVRFDLHLAAGKPQDVLTRRDQLRLARQYGVTGTASLLPVECFMREYFRQTAVVAECARHFVQLHRPVRLRERVRRFFTQHRAGRGLVVSSTDIDLQWPVRRVPLRSLEDVLHVYRLAALHRVDLSPRLERLIKQATAALDRSVSAEASRLFLDILSTPGNLASLLRSMYATGVLERLLPEIEHARCLLQFNQYHSYTVDEHTFRTLEALEEFEQSDSYLSLVYSQVHHKQLLHLALLLHDLGKGYERDHCEVGKELAERVAERFGLGRREREQLVFLVHRHLAMPHLEFWRDTTEPSVLVEFAREVGSAETLRMLFVLTAADLAGVGPGVWTSWKRDVLRSLFEKTLAILGGLDPEQLHRRLVEDVARKVRQAIVPLASNSEGSEERLLRMIETELRSFSSYYLATTPPHQIATDLEALHRLQPGEILVDARYHADTHTVDYRIMTDQRHADGCFHRIAGALTAKRLTILSAAINTTTDGRVVDLFRVVDNDFAGPPPQSRMDDVSQAIRKVLRRELTVKDLFQQQKRFEPSDARVGLSNLPTRVVVDNDTSELCTVIDVFAHDRPGLLYTIARTIYQLGLSVDLAKIGTHFDQVVDVFYVTEKHGGKVRDEARLTLIQQTLEERLAEFEKAGHVEFV